MRTTLTAAAAGLLVLTGCAATGSGTGAEPNGAPPTPVQTVQDLLGQTFEVQSYTGAGDDVTFIGPVTLNFEEDAWSVSTPCNSHGGSGVTYTDTNINVTENWLTAAGCPEDLARQSNFITEMFAGDPAWQISGEELTLTTGTMTIVALRTPSSLAGSTTVGRLEGRLLMNGGPLNPETGEQALNGSPAAAYTVTIVNERTAAKYLVMSDAAGHFSVNLPAGTYVLDCASEEQIDVEAGVVTKAECPVPVP